ncbi:hypothetical protein HMPREF2531_00626 [Bacteroides intestinalis]|uniref:Uncharacterized protein n=1 Tax=Bacteroides intestinalis TaxID=329854 RepID=A0A139LTF0_9BACE|nr:hypothetical protein HMPREF2531_00626 [Bacteroides intestinalis]
MPTNSPIHLQTETLRTDYAEFHGISKRKIREIPRLFIPYLKSNCAM